MAKKTAPLLPSTDALLAQFGDRLRLARQRRRLSAKQVAERAGMSPMTLRSLERGGSGVTMGAYLAVMQVLGIESDLGLLGAADPQGRELQDARLTRRKAVPTEPTVRRMPAVPKQELSGGGKNWREQGGFTDSEALAGLIQPPEPVSQKPKKAR
ncbi:hypothetical protein os1_27600 [Comamonadaceae bacterium OS-1]|nr:hypothetical protein os1_27600 [Comamonadaceae bacterium OS-1]